MLHRMDAGVGQVLEALDRCGLRENTLVIFASDNGPQFGTVSEGRLDRFNCQWHGAKGTVYEGGIRVPALLRWPAGLEGGRVCDAMVHGSDWYSTLSALLGADLPPDNLPIDGRNICPLLRGEASMDSPQRCWQWNRYTPVRESNAAIRDGDWKLVRPVLPAAMYVPDAHWLQTSMYNPEYFIANGIVRDPEPPREIPPPSPPELYNLAEDLHEEINLADQHPDQVRRLLRDLENWFEDVEADRATIDD
jgi:arylsulfatase A-like enzyme